MFSKSLPKPHLKQLRELSRLIAQEQYILKNVEGNTAFVPNAKQWIKTRKGIIKVLENQREDMINAFCTQLGIEGKVSIDLETGKVTEKHESEST